jgi:hypothetical protein
MTRREVLQRLAELYLELTERERQELHVLIRRIKRRRANHE